MTRPVEVDMTDPGVELQVLRWLAAQRTLGWIAGQLGCMPVAARDIAKKHAAIRDDGFVDSAKCGQAALELRERLAPPKSAAGQPAPTSPGRGQHAVPPRPGGPLTPALPDGTVLLEIPVARLKPDPDNPRVDAGDVSELAASIQAAGLLQPIVARRELDQYVIVAGHRRHLAVKQLGWKMVPVLLRREMRPDDVLAAMLIENGHRCDLDPIEEARGFARLKAQLAGTDADVAARVGRTTSYVGGRLRLLALPPAEQEALRRGEMTLREATDRAKLSTGYGGQRGMPHLSTAHPLGAAAKSRCLRLKHSRGKGQGVGGIACGECWESVIRADERRGLHAHAAKTGDCSICGGAYGPAKNGHTHPAREDLPA